MNKHLRTSDHVLFDVEERVARITLNRPNTRNALFPKMIAELRDALLEADDLNDVNVIILQGAGKDFCAGYDLKGSYAGFSDGKLPWDESRYRTVNKTIDDDIWNMEQTGQLAMTLFDMHKPVIAKIHGNCLAGGTDIALLCDMVIASEDAKIGFPAARANGTPPNQMWLYHVGPQWTKRILMTGDNLRGHEAARIGLVLDAVPADQLDNAVDELARRISYVDADLLSAHKRAVNMGLEFMGARTMQRVCTELDARAHLNAGPRRSQFKSDMAELGLKDALKKRDEPFGDGMVKNHALQKTPEEASNMSENFLIEEPIEGAKRITINRPDAMNAFTFAMYQEFVEILTRIKYDPKTRVVILTAAGNKAFCTGHDLKDSSAPAWVAEGLGKAYSTRYIMDLLCSIPVLMRNLPQPIICGVNGTVAGMAMAFTLASDLTLAAKSAKFVNALHNAGSGAELGISYMLPQLVGAQRAAEILLTAKRVSAEEAEAIGLVLRAVPDEELQNACLELARNIIVNVPLGVWVTKQSMWMNRNAGSLEQAIELESRGVFQAQSTEDKNEKRKSFFEKRDPQFTLK